MNRRWSALGSLIESFDHRRVPVATSKRKPGLFPYYGASGVVDYVDDYLFDGEYLLISEDGENLRSRSTPIAFTVNGRFWVNNHAHVVKGIDNIADTRFLSYALAVTDISGSLSGSAQPKLSQTSMNAIQLRIPPIMEQRAIAEVLGALDDKIAANNALQGATGQLTAAWFAEATSHLPQAPLSDYAQVNGLSVRPGTGTLRYLDIASVGEGSYESPTEMDWDTAPGRARRRVRRGDTVWSTVRPNRRSHALILEEDPNLICSTGLVTLTPKSSGFSFVHEASRTQAFTDYLVQIAKGSAYPAVNAAGFEGAPVPLTDDAVVDLFNELCDPLWERAASALKESRVLAQLRDALLPALMDGRLRVSDVSEERRT